MVKQSAGQTKITAATFKRDTLADQVTAAEIYFSTFIPFSAADHFNKVMFPDSQIADRFASGRTKTTAIVKYALLQCSMMKLLLLAALLLSPSCVTVAMIKQIVNISE